jgi:hypothetical protein
LVLALASSEIMMPIAKGIAITYNLSWGFMVLCRDCTTAFSDSCFFRAAMSCKLKYDLTVQVSRPSILKLHSLTFRELLD